MIRVCCVVAMTTTMMACAGRAPQPVATVQAHDRTMNCDALMAEIEANNKRVSELAEERGLKVAQNVAAGVAGLVIPVLWFGMDWQGTQSTEINALQSRQQYLGRLAEERCAAPATTARAKR